MNAAPAKILKTLHPKRILLPMIIGFLVVGYMIWQNFDVDTFYAINWSWNVWFWLGMSFLMIAIRHIAYMYRIRLLTDNEISWRKSFDVILMWEFASSVTPSIVGGTAAALFIVNKEGINMGRSTAVVTISAMLDELFFIVMVPLLMLIVGIDQMFAINLDDNLNKLIIGDGLLYFFIIGYIIILVLTIIMTFGVFINPGIIKNLLIRIFSFRFLKRWKDSAVRTGDELIIASSEMKQKSFGFWLKAFVATFISWTARYWIVNCLLLAFISVNDHFLVYARQMVMWVIMLISPTPGSSGIAEIVFLDFLRDIIPAGLASPLAFMWRIVSYYPYLILGVLILPRWLRRVYRKEEVIA